VILINFNSDTNHLEADYNDEVTAKEVIDYITATKVNKKYPRVLKIISDTRNSSFNLSIEELNSIVEENFKSLENYSKIIDAIIVDDPKTTVLTMLYKQFSKNDKYKFEIFSTKEAALNWLEKW
jgi:hypothetical protein